MPEGNTPEAAPAAAPVAPVEPAAPVQGPPVPTPAATQPAATPPPAAPAPSQGSPWDNDLAEKFSDEATRQQVDAYLRENVQPHVTKLEQSSKPARELYDAFVDKPDDTFAEVAAELYGPDAAKAIQDFVASVQPPGQAQPTETPQPEQPTLDPRVQAIIDEREAAHEKAAYDAEVATLKQNPRYSGIDGDLLLPFVAREDDFPKAAEAYLEWSSRFANPAAPAPESAPATPGEPSASAPPALGTQGGGSPVPTQKEGQSLGEAIQDFFDEQSASGTPLAPPVPSA